MLKVRSSVLALAGICLSVVHGAAALSLREDFSGDPATNGWQSYGNAQLFSWDASARNLRVTWDSTQSNSYFAKPLGTTLTRYDDFSLSFDLRLTNASIAGYGFEIAIGLLNLSSAARPGFLRGTGADSPNLAEFDYFPDPLGTLAWGPSITVMMADYVGKDMTTNWSRGGFAGLSLEFNDLYHVEMVYSGSDQRLRTTMTRNGEPFGPVPDSVLGSDFLDFHVDHLSISSYSDAGAFGGSVLAQGSVGNLVLTAAAQPVAWLRRTAEFTNPVELQFHAHTNWVYTLERTTDFHEWTLVSGTIAGDESDVRLRDTNAISTNAFYRVQARQP
jgi:hypothetical protein